MTMRMPERSHLVAQVGDALDLLGADQIGHPLHQGRFIHLIGDLGDDDRGAILADLLELGAGAQDDAAAPVSKACLMPERPRMMAAVGKSGPGTMAMSSSSVMPGFSIIARVASMISVGLWGGILVAMPTAMPCAPLTRRLGKLAGRTLGSSALSS